MGCYKPLSACRLPDGRVVMGKRQQALAFFTLPCGQCIGCRIERSRKWAVRIVHESRMHEDNCFITLTYDVAHYPQYGSLNYRDYQLFMKRLRKHFGGKEIRFFCCGEYGDKLGRPHFHACLFGIDFDDKEIIRNGKNPLYYSDTLNRLWGLGFVSVGSLTFASAQYVSAYVTKKVTGDKAHLHYQRVNSETGEVYSVEPEFVRMSLGGRTGRGGIGSSWYDKFSRDVFPHDRVVINGTVSSPPRYYFNKYSKSNEADADRIRQLRLKRFRGRLLEYKPVRRGEVEHYTLEVYRGFNRNNIK